MFEKSSMARTRPVEAHSGKAVFCADAADEVGRCPDIRRSSLPPGSLVSELHCNFKRSVSAPKIGPFR